MRYLIPCFALVAASALSLSAIAQPPEKDGKKGGDKRAEIREKLLKEFDTNHDGKLDEQERAKAREKMRQMRAAHMKGGQAGARGQAGGHGKAGAHAGAGARGPEG